MIHLDTSFLIRGLVAGTPEAIDLRRWIATGEQLGVSVIAWTEFRCGPLSDEAVVLAEQLLGAPEAFTASHAELSAKLYNASGRQRGTLVDCMIAATAIIADADLATSNSSDFARLNPLGLRLA
ncbi:MAG: type II toxin-antitoxin system VapC family toxin [Gemmatimonadota bacterium]